MLHAIIVNDDEERREQVVDEILGKHDETSVQRETRNVDETNEDEEDSGGVFDYILSKLVDNKRRKVSRNGPPIDCVRNTQKAYALLPTIVYVWRRDEAESLSDYLKSQDVSAAAYHAGMERSQRSRVQLMFNKGTINVVVATVAFGMGIDKSNVRRVIHASLPKSVENYVQVGSIVHRVYTWLRLTALYYLHYC
jgi:superfamily II DNA/RNA helicase